MKQIILIIYLKTLPKFKNLKFKKQQNRIDGDPIDYIEIEYINNEWIIIKKCMIKDKILDEYKQNYDGTKKFISPKLKIKIT